MIAEGKLKGFLQRNEEYPHLIHRCFGEKSLGFLRMRITLTCEILGDNLIVSRTLICFISKIVKISSS